MTPDPLASIAESFKTTAVTQQLLAQTQHELYQAVLRNEETQRALAQTHRVALRIQSFALVLLGATLAFLGYVVGQHVIQGAERAALIQAQALPRAPSRDRRARRRVRRGGCARLHSVAREHKNARHLRDGGRDRPGRRCLAAGR